MSRSGFPNGVEGDSSESTYWYVMLENRQIGPMTFSRLRQMARQGTLAAGTQVRKGESGNWMDAGSVEGMFFAAPTVSATATVQDLPIPKPPGILANFATSTRDRVQIACSGVIDGIAGQMRFVRAVISWIALVAVAVGLVFILIRNFPQFWFAASDPMETYTSLWDELKEKRTANASSTEWDAFAVRAEKELAPIVVRLERIASADNRVAQQLLWAGRDYFPMMLDDARSGVSGSEEKFDYHLVRAQWLTEGKDLEGKPAYRPNLYGSTTDTSTILLGAVFVIVDLWVVVWFVRKKLSNRNAA
jgi:hypothetical protein